MMFQQLMWKSSSDDDFHTDCRNVSHHHQQQSDDDFRTGYQNVSHHHQQKSDDDFRTGCWNPSHHHQQSFSGIHSPRPSHYTFKICHAGIQKLCWVTFSNEHHICLTYIMYKQRLIILYILSSGKTFHTVSSTQITGAWLAIVTGYMMALMSSAKNIVFRICHAVIQKFCWVTFSCEYHTCLTYIKYKER